MAKLVPITIRTLDNKLHAASGYEVGAFLTVHRALECDLSDPVAPACKGATGSTWVVAHKQTGLYLGRGFPTRRAAFEAASACEEAIRCEIDAGSADIPTAARAFDAGAVCLATKASGGF